MVMKVLIIGGVAGGATAAARLRRLDESAEIVILERSGYVSYANCGLPYYIGGVIEKKQALTLQTKESFWNRFYIDVRLNNEALSIDRERKTVRVRRLLDGSEYEETYDKLILSPGAKALRPPLPGIDSPRIFTLRTVEDTFAIREQIEKTSPKNAVVIGGGFIGLEMAENLIHAGVKTTLLQRGDQVMAPLDYDMACQIHSYLRGRGVDLRLNQTVTGFYEEDGRLYTQLEGREAVGADLAILAIGVAPETHLAKEAGLSLGIRESILVNERMETSDPDIYAVGDAVQVRHFVSGADSLIALAGPANKQGRIAADNICGRDSRFDGSQGSSIIRLFDMTAASTGLNEKAATAAGIPWEAVVTYSASHATYYPGATDMTVKTLYNPENGRILGAQIVGFDGVDKRIDVLATAIRAVMTGEDLEELDLAYAPPYSSAKDPVNMAGFVIGNIRSGLLKQFNWKDLEELQKQRGEGKITLLDTRTEREYAQGHFQGSVNIPLDELRERLSELDPQKPVYVNCHSGLRSYLACRILTGNGFECYNFSGGYRFYEYIAGDRNYDETPRHACGVEIR